jgi:putative ABC transport system permease protein
MFSTVLRESMRAITRNPIRSLLTMLGIIMGVASFISVVALGNAGASRVEEQLQNVGDNLVWVEAGSRSRNGLRLGNGNTKSLVAADALAILDQLPLIKAASLNVDGRVQVIGGLSNWGTTYRGVSPEYFTIRRWEFERGATFTSADVERNAAVCVIGQTLVDNLYPREDPIGRVLRVKDMPCVIVGTLKPHGAGPNGQDQDDFVILPYTTAQKRISGNLWLDDIYFSATTRDDIPRATEQITALLRERHHLRAGEPDDFNIRSPEDAIQAQLQASRIFTLLLASIASISLVVGGIGIMNIMLVSVSQRTKEIGVRLAVGATERHIQLQFLGEAMVLSVTGGVLGVGGGYLAADMLNELLDWPMLVTGNTVVLAAGFSLMIGMVFGFYPAYRASQMDPIHCLRQD